MGPKQSKTDNNLLDLFDVLPPQIETCSVKHREIIQPKGEIKPYEKVTSSAFAEKQETQEKKEKGNEDTVVPSLTMMSTAKSAKKELINDDNDTEKEEYHIDLDPSFKKLYDLGLIHFPENFTHVIKHSSQKRNNKRSRILLNDATQNPESSDRVVALLQRQPAKYNRQSYLPDTENEDLWRHHSTFQQLRESNLFSDETAASCIEVRNQLLMQVGDDILAGTLFCPLEDRSIFFTNQTNNNTVNKIEPKFSFKIKSHFLPDEEEQTANDFFPITIPATTTQLANLYKDERFSKSSPLGVEGRGTIHDRRLRSSREVLADQLIDLPEFLRTNEGFQNAFPTQVEAIQRRLAASVEELYFEPYKIQIYKPGDFFKPHQDSVDSGDLIGTLVLHLPCEGDYSDPVFHRRNVDLFSWDLSDSDATEDAPDFFQSHEMLLHDADHDRCLDKVVRRKKKIRAYRSKDRTSLKLPQKVSDDEEETFWEKINSSSSSSDEDPENEEEEREDQDNESKEQNLLTENKSSKKKHAPDPEKEKRREERRKQLLAEETRKDIEILATSQFRAHLTPEEAEKEKEEIRETHRPKSFKEIITQVIPSYFQAFKSGLTLLPSTFSFSFSSLFVFAEAPFQQEDQSDFGNIEIDSEMKVPKWMTPNIVSNNTPKIPNDNTQQHRVSGGALRFFVGRDTTAWKRGFRRGKADYKFPLRASAQFVATVLLQNYDSQELVEGVVTQDPAFANILAIDKKGSSIRSSKSQVSKPMTKDQTRKHLPLHFAAFLTNVYHDVRPIRSGMRMTLQYKIYKRGQQTSPWCLSTTEVPNNNDSFSREDVEIISELKQSISTLISNLKKDASQLPSRFMVDADDEECESNKKKKRSKNDRKEISKIMEYARRVNDVCLSPESGPQQTLAFGVCLRHQYPPATIHDPQHLKGIDFKLYQLLQQPPFSDQIECILSSASHFREGYGGASFIVRHKLNRTIVPTPENLELVYANLFEAASKESLETRPLPGSCGFDEQAEKLFRVLPTLRNVAFLDIGLGQLAGGGQLLGNWDSSYYWYTKQAVLICALKPEK